MIKTVHAPPEEVRPLVDQFLQASANRFVLGINQWSEKILNQIEVNGIVDDFSTQKTHNGYKIYKTHELPPDSIVVCCVINSPLTVKEKLDKLNIKNIDYLSFYHYAHTLLDLLSPPHHLENFSDFFKQHKDQFELIYGTLSDNMSKKVFESIINLRINNNILLVKDSVSKNRRTLQYFEFISTFKNRKITFVDGGGFTGDTTQIFLKHFKNNYEKIYFFEPSKNNIQIAKKNLQGVKNIIYHPKGLYREETILNFVTEGISSHISSTECGTQIPVTTLDKSIDEPIDFIKLDIEGAELDAIEGAKNIIREQTPFMAICVYHKPDDLFKIPLSVLSINKNYDLVLRHYGEGATESVMYFMPK